MPTFIKAGFWETLCKKCTGYKGWLNLDQFVESKLPQPAYKVYTALLTQSGGDNLNSTGGGNLTIGVTYEIIDNAGYGWDFTNVGAPNNNIGTKFVATGTTPNSWGVDGQLDYNLGAPVVTVLENTIGNIVWSYVQTGYYFGTLDNSFPLEKTFCQGITTTVEDGTGLLVITVKRDTIDRISVSSTNPISETPLDDLLFNTPIEIRVYP